MKKENNIWKKIFKIYCCIVFVPLFLLFTFILSLGLDGVMAHNDEVGQNACTYCGYDKLTGSVSRNGLEGLYYIECDYNNNIMVKYKQVYCK